MVFTKILFNLICYQQILCIGPDSLVPHSDVLNGILDANELKNYTETNTISVFDYLFGISPNITELEKTEVSDNLDICLLTPENIKKLVERAQTKFEMVSFRNESSKDSRRNYIYYYNYEYVTKAMNWMKQSIYGTRRRLEVTRAYRKKFHMNISYNIGVLYGILNEMMLKVESMFSQMLKIHFHFPYLWFVLSYQRILGFNVDITYIVERMFDFQKKWNALIGRKEKGESEEQVEGLPENMENQTALNPELDQNVNIWGNVENEHGEEGEKGKSGQQWGPGQDGGQEGGPDLNGGPGNQGGPNDHFGPGDGDTRWDQNPHDGQGPGGGLDFPGGGPGGPDGPGPPGGPPSGPQ